MPKRKRDASKKLSYEIFLLNEKIFQYYINYTTFKTKSTVLKIEEIFKNNTKKILDSLDPSIISLNKNLNEVFFLAGIMFSDGIYVEKNDELAFKYTKMACDTEFSIAYHVLSCMYERGIGTVINYGEASKYLKLSADNNYIFSQSRLARAYEQGSNLVEKDIVSSFKYYKLAADNTSEMLYDHRDWITESKEIKKKCIYKVACFYSSGTGVEKNNIEAFKYTKLSVEANVINAFNDMFMCYLHGFGVVKNFEEAMKYLKIGIEKKDDKAIFSMICLCYNDETYNYPQNLDEGMKYIKLFLEDVTTENLKTNTKFSVKGQLLYNIIYILLLQNDLELKFVQHIILKYPVYGNLNSLLQFKLNKCKLANYSQKDNCIICYDENIDLQMFDCLGHYYCKKCTIKIKECCLCKGKKRCFH
jgi:TPR repeat protein